MRLAVISGPMFAGKSGNLLQRVRRAQVAGLPVLVAKHSLDGRYHATSVAAHDGASIEAHAVTDLEGLDPAAASGGLVALDEIQFFGAPRLLSFLGRCRAAGVADVVMAGLALDFRGRPFMSTMAPLPFADEWVKLSAVCTRRDDHGGICGADAGYSQRLVDGSAVVNGEVVAPGGQEMYEARCDACFVRPHG